VRLIGCCLMFYCVCSGAGAQPQLAQKRDLASISLEDLMNIHVTSAFKEDQKMSQVAAAVFIIGQEEVRRTESSQNTSIAAICPILPPRLTR